MGNYQERFYRHQPAPPCTVAFYVRYRASDLYVLVDDASYREHLQDILYGVLVECHQTLADWFGEDERFCRSLEPYPLPEEAPPLARVMARAAGLAGVGPMAAVAGAIAQRVAGALEPEVRQVTVENGGDIYVRGGGTFRAGIFAGASPLSMRLALVAEPPVAICTSSGTVGHSFSQGCADAAVVVGCDGALTDAIATALGNRVKRAEDIPGALEWVKDKPGIQGAVIIFRDTMGAVGVTLEPVGT